MSTSKNDVTSQNHKYINTNHTIEINIKMHPTDLVIWLHNTTVDLFNFTYINTDTLKPWNAKTVNINVLTTNGTCPLNTDMQWA